MGLDRIIPVLPLLFALTELKSATSSVPNDHSFCFFAYIELYSARDVLSDNDKGSSLLILHHRRCGEAR